MDVNLLFKRWHKPCLVFEVLGGCRTQLVTQECGISWEHLWETCISHSLGYYLDTWLQHKTSHVNIDFHWGNYSNWAVSTYFKSASPLLSSLAAEREAWPWAGDPIALATTDERWSDWSVLCSPWAILASPGWVSAGFWQSLMWWQACWVFIVDAGVPLATWLAYPSDWGRWVWHMKLQIVLLLLKKSRDLKAD